MSSPLSIEAELPRTVPWEDIVQSNIFKHMPSSTTIQDNKSHKAILPYIYTVYPINSTNPLLQRLLHNTFHLVSDLVPTTRLKLEFQLLMS